MWQPLVGMEEAAPLNIVYPDLTACVPSQIGSQHREVQVTMRYINRRLQAGQANGCVPGVAAVRVGAVSRRLIAVKLGIELPHLQPSTKSGEPRLEKHGEMHARVMCSMHMLCSAGPCRDIV